VNMTGIYNRNTEESEDSEEDSRFSKLITEGLADNNSRLRVFKKITECFPNEPHFWSHLARFYNLKMKDYDSALEAIDFALDLSSQQNGKDATLHHIKGMTYKNKVGNLIDRWWGNKQVQNDVIKEIQNLIELASEQFEFTREYNSRSDYGYISNIDVITKYIDFKFSISKYEDRAQFLTHMNAYDLELFANAEQLLEELRSKINYDINNFYYTRAKSDVAKFLSDYSSIIQGWTNLLDPSKSSKRPVVRRLLVHAYVGRADGWRGLDEKDIDRILTLMEENISSDPGDSRNVFLWFKAARCSSKISIPDAIEKLSRWRTINGSIDASFYLSILHSIQAIGGNSISRIRAEELLSETSHKSRMFTNRGYSSEWLGKGIQLEKILEKEIAAPWVGPGEMEYNIEELEEVTGKVIEIRGPESGLIELTCGLRAFFVPARAEGGTLFKDRDQNIDVSFLLGFSYDGLRAFKVRRVNK